MSLHSLVLLGRHVRFEGRCLGLISLSLPVPSSLMCLAGVAGEGDSTVAGKDISTDVATLVSNQGLRPWPSTEVPSALCGVCALSCLVLWQTTHCTNTNRPQDYEWLREV